MDTRLSPVLICVSLVLLSGLGQLVICSQEKGTYNDVVRMKLGGFRDSTNNRNGGGEIDGLALFAVQEHNKRENGVVELVRVLKATEQVVAGKLYSLTLEVKEAGEKKIYEAKVWVKPWINFKQLQEFKSVVPSFTVSDLGLKSDVNGFEWRSVSTKDPEVQEAAKHAVKSIQQRSNSLFPYKLIDIILARAKVVEDRVKFELLLKLEKGNKAEKLMVEVMKYQNGKFH
ncbi:PREDICTED: cysteine proteinase inhibitor 7 [Brassica oleracea var. oleracea]|uniref:Cysteine proteinase inhibitor n=1 Tax=Brassica oleracea var. oleracea TaxID=109376 RepID=A0A0D3AZT2_BRAOL|nr:PREDICTED: cysteine proteinase inhibitor 7 [Brassica oleracea var. oleracea]